MNTLNKDRNTLKRLVESYGKKDVLNYLNHLNESAGMRLPKPIWKYVVDFMDPLNVKEEGSLTPEGIAYIKAYKQLSSIVPMYHDQLRGNGWNHYVYCYTPEQCQVFYDFMIDYILWEDGELVSEPLSFLCPGLAELVPNRRLELEGKDEEDFE